MRAAAAYWAALALAGIGAGCALPLGAPRVAAPAVVVERAGGGELAVRGESPYAPGPQVYVALRREPTLNAALACQGEPDALEVLAGGGDAPRVVLRYRRGPPRELWIAPSDLGVYVAAPPRPLRPAAQDVPARGPTPAQREECPFDPGRPDCEAHCAAGPQWEWCHY